MMEETTAAFSGGQPPKSPDSAHFPSLTSTFKQGQSPQIWDTIKKLQYLLQVMSPHVTETEDELLAKYNNRDMTTVNKV